jgi:hypothetical protein
MTLILASLYDENAASLLGVALVLTISVRPSMLSKRFEVVYAARARSLDHLILGLKQSDANVSSADSRSSHSLD